MSRRASFNYSRALDAAALAARAAQRAAADAARRAEAERRHAEWAARSASITRQHLDRYQAILDDIHNQGLDAFVGDDVDTAEGMIARARALSASDPAGAKALSQSIGPIVGPLPRAARQQRGEHRAAEYQRQTKTGAGGRPTGPDLNERPPAPVESPQETVWRETLDGWTDHYTRDLVYTELAALRHSLDTDAGPTAPADVIAALGELRARAESEAAGLRRAEAEVEEMQRSLAAESPEPSLGIPPTEHEDISMVGNPEESRREAVRGVMSALEDAGFQVENPRLIQLSPDSNEVVVVGTRASGASATFSLTLDGKLEYDFSGYKGSTCDADIDAVVPALQEIYGIQLTEEVVAWRNPDDQDADARPQPGRTNRA
jgi:hypothetical protein